MSKRTLIEELRASQEVSENLTDDGEPSIFQLAADRIEELEMDAKRYGFLRDSDNWGDDSGDDSWEVLAESSMVVFDEIVDSRMAKAQ